MHSNLVLSTKRTRVSNAVAAGTTAINTTILDMESVDSVVWSVMFGALTATQVTSIKAQVGNDPALADATDVVGATAGPLADADSNKMLTLEMTKVAGYRYCRLVILRATANAAVDGAIATQYTPRKEPTSDDATTSSAATLSVSPAPSNAALTNATTTYAGSTTKINTTARTSS